MVRLAYGKQSTDVVGIKVWTSSVLWAALATVFPADAAASSPLALSTRSRRYSILSFMIRKKLKSKMLIVSYKLLGGDHPMVQVSLRGTRPQQINQCQYSCLHLKN